MRTCIHECSALSRPLGPIPQSRFFIFCPLLPITGCRESAPARPTLQLDP